MVEECIVLYRWALLIFILFQIVSIFRLKKAKAALSERIERLKIKEDQLLKNVEGLEETVIANERANKIQNSDEKYKRT